MMMMLLLVAFILSGCATALAVAQYSNLKDPDRTITALSIMTCIFLFSICLCGAIEHHIDFEKSVYGTCQ